MADIVFILCVSRVVTKINCDLKDLGLAKMLSVEAAASAFGLCLDDMPLSNSVPVLAPMWVDDLAVPLLTNAGPLFTSVGRAMAVVWNIP